MIFLLFWQTMTPRPKPEIASVQQETATDNLPSSSLNSQATLEITETSQDLPQVTIGNLNITYSPTGGYIKELIVGSDTIPLAFKNIGFVPKSKDKKFSVSIGKESIAFTRASGERKEFVFKGDLWEINLDFPPPTIVLFSNYLHDSGLDKRYQEIFFSQNQTIQRSSAQRIKEVTYRGLDFAGARDRYYCLSLLPGSYDLGWRKQIYKLEKNQRVEERTRADFYLENPGSKITIYLGPQIKDRMEPLGLQEVVYYGFWHSLALLIIKLLHFFHFLTKSWGLSIVLFSIGTYALLFPLTLKSSKGMKEMREFQQIHSAEIAKIKEKYKNDTHKVHEATMEFYKKHSFNPLKGCSSGCLPMLFQFPIILAFWAAVPRAWELKNASFLWIKDLSLPDRLLQLPFTLPFSLGQWLNILPLLTAALMYVQMQLNSPADPEQAQQQKMMGLFMPIMLGFFFYNMPSAMLLYWFTNSVLTFFTQRKVMANK